MFTHRYDLTRDSGGRGRKGEGKCGGRGEREGGGGGGWRGWFLGSPTLEADA